MNTTTNNTTTDITKITDNIDMYCFSEYGYRKMGVMEYYGYSEVENKYIDDKLGYVIVTRIGTFVLPDNDATEEEWELIVKDWEVYIRFAKNDDDTYTVTEVVSQYESDESDED